MLLLKGGAQVDVMLSPRGFHLKNNTIFKVRNLEKSKIEDNIWEVKAELCENIMEREKCDNTIIWFRKSEEIHAGEYC